MKTLMRATALAAILATAAMSAQAQPQPASAADSLFRATTLNLSAYGEVRMAPDMAVITLGSNATAPTAAEAIQLNAARMNAVITALRRQGVADKDIQTSGLSLNPQYVYEQNLPPKLTGYQASNMVTIRVMDITKVGQAIDAVTAAGANQIQGISFGLKSPEAAENQARRQAVTALKAKADLYAGATGLKLVRLVNLSEGGGYSAPPPMPMPMMARMAKEDSTPISGGEIAVRVDVNAVYELGR